MINNLRLDDLLEINPEVNVRVYALYTSSKYDQMYLNKVVHEENRDIVLTNGIGNGMLPIRYFAIPEIVEITLK